MNHKSRVFANGQHDLKRGVDSIGVTCSFICRDGHSRILMTKRSQPRLKAK